MKLNVIKFICLVQLWALVSSGMLSAQTVITIGTGTTTSENYPFNGYYDYSWSNVIYKASDIGTDGLITKVAFYVNNTRSSNYVMNSQKIYVRHTTSSAYTTSTYPGTAGFTLVFDGTITYNANTTGWKDITLTTPFVYNGSNNLEFLFENRDGSYNATGFPYFRVTTGLADYRTRRDYSDYSFPSSCSSCNKLTVIPNIQLTIQPCGITLGTVAALPTTILPGATSSLTITGQDQNSTLQWQSSIDNATFTNISGATNTSYTTAALYENTYYRVQQSYNGCVKYTTSALVTVDVSSLTTSTVGTGTSVTEKYPFNGYYDYSWSNIIYKASEINSSGQLARVSFYVDNSPVNFVMNNQKIYVRHTTANGYSNTSYPGTTGYTLVFDGSITYNGSGWKEIVLSTPFGYNGIDNLEFLFENRDGSYGTDYPVFRGQSGMAESRVKRDYKDASFPTTCNLCGSYNNIINIKMKFLPCNYNAGSVVATNSPVFPGNTATLIISGQDPAATVQWQSSIDNINFTTVAGATNTQYVSPALTNTSYYRVLLSKNGCSKLTASSSVTINVSSLTTSTIGTGTAITEKYPFDGYYNYSWSNAIYKASEINASGKLARISFYVDNSPSNCVMNNQRIYVQNTTATGYTQGGYTGTSSGDFSLIYDGSITYNGSGWKEIVLNNLFDYNGTDNLEFLFENRDGSYTTDYPMFRIQTGMTENRTKRDYDDASFPASCVYCDKVNNLVNIKMQFLPNQTAGYFRSAQSGDWNQPNTWQYSADNITWEAANTAPDFHANTITIQSAHNVTITASTTIDQTVVNGTLVYGDNSGSTITINNGTGTDLTINGTFQDLGANPISWIASSSWSIGNSGTLLRTRSTSSDNWRDQYQNGISTIPATANWIIRKTGTDNPTLSSAGGMVYPNLIIENNTGTTWVTSSTSGFTGSTATPIIKGNFDIGGNGTGNVSFINDNTFTSPILVNGNISIKTGSTLRSYGTGFEVQGNLAVNGSTDYGTGNAKFVFSGNNNQNIAGSGTIAFKNVQLNKASTSATVTLQNPASVNGEFTFTNGYLIANATNVLTFENGASASAASNNSFVEGIANKIGNSAFAFPIGKNGNFQPISISAPSNSAATYSAEYFHSDPALGTAKDSTIDSVSTCEFWTLNNVGTAYPVNVTLGWNGQSCLIAQGTGNMRLTEWNSSKWIDLGNSSSTLNIITSSSSVNTFGTFSIAQRKTSCGYAIPLTITNHSISGIVQHGNEMWFTFVADDTTKIVREYTNAGSVNQIKRIELYSGNCNSLILVDTAIVVEDSLMGIRCTNLIIGDTYYIKTIKSGIINGDAQFDISLLSQTVWAWSLNTSSSTPSVINSNSYFTAYLSVCVGTSVKIWGNYPDVTTLLNWTCSSGGGFGTPCPFSFSNSPVQIITFNNTGTFHIHASPQGTNPFDYTELQVFVSPTVTAPVITLSTGNTICSGQSTTLTATSTSTGGTYLWSPGGYTTSVITVSPTSTTTYTVTYSNSCSSASSSTTITVIDPLNITVNSPTICSGQTAQLVANGSTSSFSWSAGATSTGVNTADASPTTTTTYTVTGASNGCATISNTAIATVTVNPLPIVSVNSPTVCAGEPVILTANGSSGYNYFWSSGASPTYHGSNIADVPTINGTYTVTVVDNNLCSNSATATVTVNPLPPFPTITGDLRPCIGTASFYTISSYDPTYNYSIDLLPSSTGTAGALVDNLDGTATFPVTWSNSSGTIIVTVINPATSCSNNAQLDVLPANCCEGSSPIESFGFVSNNGSYTIVSDIVTGGYVTLRNVTFGISSPLNQPVKITVLSGATLVLEHCHLYSCDNMWQGIVVNAGGQVIIRGTDYQGNYLGSTLIEDALVAADILFTGQTVPVPSTKIIVNDAIFNRNITAISVEDNFMTIYPNLGPEEYATPLSIKNAVFTSRDLWTNPHSWPNASTLKALTDQNLLTEHYSVESYNPSDLKPNNLGFCGSHPDCHPRTGIILKGLGEFYDPNLVIPNITKIYIGDGAADASGNNPYLNVFDNLGFGIDATNSSFYSCNNAFQHIHQNGTHIFGTALKAVSNNISTPYDKIDIFSDVAGYKGPNYFYDCINAVSVTDYFDIRVKDCNIRSNRGNAGAFGANGITINNYNSTQVTIDNNTITNIQNGIQFFGGLNEIFDPTVQSIGPVTITNNIIQADLQGMSTTTPNGSVDIGIYTSNLIHDYATYNQFYNNLLIQNNHLYNVNTGIVADNWSQLYGAAANPLIDNNYISMIPDISGSPQYGILSTINNNVKITNNNILETGGSLTDPSIGISCQDNNYSTDIGCNSVSNTGTGIEFINNPSTNSTSFKNNIMDGAGKGFVLDNSAIGDQGTTTAASNNEWLNMNNSGQFTTFVTNVNTGVTDVFHSKLYVQQGSSTLDPTIAGTCSSTYLTDRYYFAHGLVSATGGSNNCGTLPNHSPTTLNDGNTSGQQKSLLSVNGVDIHLLEQMVMDSITYTNFETEQHINDKFRVYRMLCMDSTLRDSSLILQTFYNIAANSNIGNLANTENALAAGKLTTAKAFLNIVTPSNAIETNYKNYYDCYIKYKDSIYTLSDSVTLKSLVLGCPTRDGIIVYQAKSLYSLIYNDFTLYRNNCKDESGTREYIQTKIVSKDLFVNLYPNPTTGDLNIQFDKDLINKKVEITIFDVTGVLVLKQNILIENVNKINLNMNSGVYFISIKPNDDSIKSYKGKVTVIK